MVWKPNDGLKKSYFFFTAILVSISDAILEFYSIFKMEFRAKYYA